MLFDSLMPIDEDSEDYWRNREPWLLSCGYQLRPRFRKGWVPSWITSPPSNPAEVLFREDSIMLFVLRFFSLIFLIFCLQSCQKSAAIDVIRLKDGKPLMLKRTLKAASNGEETRLTALLSSSPLVKDPRNHCIRLIDVFPIPDEEDFEILVLPLLRPFDSPRFDTVGECVDLFQQIFKGLQFLHDHRIAHRDCTGLNLMMDGSDMFPQGWHPADPMMNRQYTADARHYTRTQRPPKYYWIDFGLSLQFNENDTNPKSLPMRGNDRTVPELQGKDYQSVALNPFPADIYYLGNLVRRHFTEGDMYTGAKLGFKFIKPLVDDMVQEDPAKRPTIDECVARLDNIVGSLSSWKLRSQVCHSTDNIFGYIYRFFPYLLRRISYVIRRIPPIPFWQGDSNSINSRTPLL